MKFAVGFQLFEGEEEPFSHIVADYREHISEVFFAWQDIPSGRGSVATLHGFTDWNAQRKTEEELRAAREVFSTVGTGYMDEQLRLLDGGIDAFSSLLVKEREACARDVKLINTLSASLSVGIAIILI